MFAFIARWINFFAILLCAGWLAACVDFASPATPIPIPTPRVNAPDSIAAVSPRPIDLASSLRFRRLSIEQGLSQSSVRAITQDPRGFMWFGTEDGLNRYDGYTFKAYKFDPDNPRSLGNNAIMAMCADAFGAIWIGTEANGVDRFDWVSEEFTHYRADNSALSNNRIRVLFADSRATLWIGTEAGLNYLDLETNQLRNLQYDVNAPAVLQRGSVYAIYETAGILWFGTRDGLVRYDRAANDYRVYRNVLEDPSSLSYNAVSAIAQDAQGQLWVGTFGGGVNILDANGNSFTRVLSRRDDPASLNSNNIVAILNDQKNILWIATNERGIYRYDAERKRFVRSTREADNPNGLSSDNVRALYQDRAGSLWIGTFSGGVNLLDHATTQFAYYRSKLGEANSLSNNVIFAAYAESKEVVWVGTQDGLDRLDRATGQVTHFKNDPANPHSLGAGTVRVIYRDRAGTLWVGTEIGGLSKFDPAKNQFTRFVRDSNDASTVGSNTVTALYEDDAGAFWVGTNNGLDKMERATGTFTHYRAGEDPNTLSNNVVMAIEPARDGGLWIGTYAGLNKFDPGTGRVTRYMHDANANSLSGDFVVDVYDDRAGIVWIGTYTAGLNKFEPATGKFTPYREKQGLPNDTVYAILPDAAGNLWLSTNNGIAKFDPRAETVKNFSADDGLQGAEFNNGASAASPAGELFFGGINGLTAFYPADIRTDEPAAPLVLTQLTQAGEALALPQAVDATRELVLTFPQNYFEFEFAALGFANAANVQYAYLLDGFDREWNKTGNRRAGRYTNLPGGTYTLRVIAANGAGEWNRASAPLTITVVPPLWDAVWFRIAMGALLALIIAVGYQLRVRDVRARNRALEKRLDESTWALRAQTHELEEQQHELRGLYESEQRRAEQFQTIAEIGRNSTASLNTREILQQVTRLFQQAFGYYHVGIGMVEGDEIVYREGAGKLWDDPTFAFKPQRLKIGKEGLTGWVAALGEPVLVPDVRQDARYVEMQGSATLSEMLAPIIVQEKLIGVLDVQSDQLAAFDQTDLAVAQAIAHQTGIAIENARLYEHAQELAVLQERNRLARDLHDAVTQTLFSASLIADALPSTWEANADEGRQLLKELRQLSRGALAEMRTLLLELRPAALVETPLGTLLRQLGEAAAGRAGLRVQIHAASDCKLPADAHIALYRIAQEAVNNILKHARAANLTIALTCGDRAGCQHIELVIGDDGRGFDPALAPSDHFGLRNMRERAQAIGAELTITSQPQHGARLQVVWQNKEHVE